MRGRLADAISHGLMDEPVQIHSHGGRVKLLQDGELNIDVAFLGVPCSDEFATPTGRTENRAAVRWATPWWMRTLPVKVVLLTEALVPFPNMPASLVQDQVDYIMQVESVGDPAKISVGAARVTSNPRELMIARLRRTWGLKTLWLVSKTRLLDADRPPGAQGHRLHPFYGKRRWSAAA